MMFERIVSYPKGTLSVVKHEHNVIVCCRQEFIVECNDDQSWHFIIDSSLYDMR